MLNTPQKMAFVREDSAKVPMPFIIYQKKNKTEMGRSFVRSILDDFFFFLVFI